MTTENSQVISICRLVQKMHERESKISSREEEARSTYAQLLEKNEQDIEVLKEQVWWYPESTALRVLESCNCFAKLAKHKHSRSSLWSES